MFFILYDFFCCHLLFFLDQIFTSNFLSILIIRMLSFDWWFFFLYWLVLFVSLRFCLFPFPFFFKLLFLNTTSSEWSAMVFNYGFRPRVELLGHRVYVQYMFSLLSGCTYLHVHQKCNLHIKSLLALSVISSRNCKCFGVSSVVSYGSYMREFFFFW